MINPADLNGRILLHCCKDGTITFRQRGEPVFNGRALPFFSVETADDALALQVTCCKAQYHEHPLMPGRTWYVDPTFTGELEDLPRMSQRYREMLAEIHTRRAERPEED